MDFLKSLITMLPKYIISFEIINGEFILYILPQYLTQVVLFLKSYTNAQYHLLIDITAIDCPSHLKRFQVIYQLLSLQTNSRIRLKIEIELNESVPSITSIFPNANWLERETWDMFGIPFKNHPDLRRLLTDYGFSGFPLRKDFPLTGYTELRYDDEEKRIISESIKLNQEFRFFNLTNSWKQI